jgi:calcineurin-like phosphoesterase family protein
MTIYFTADLHVFHDNIIKYCDRPYKDHIEMWEGIRDGWNSTVTEDDETWILGDFTLKGKMYKQKLAIQLSELNGRKHLVYGNHDRLKVRDHKDIGFTLVEKKYHLHKETGFYLAHDPALANCVPKNSVFLCGHVHNLFTQFITPEGIIIINVGVDVRNFKPISVKEIKQILASDIELRKYPKE